AVPGERRPPASGRTRSPGIPTHRIPFPTTGSPRRRSMFFRDRRLQSAAKPERPDPVYARKLQEVLGGQWGEISVMMSYLFQGWNCRGPAKYRDMILDIGTEEISHVEMLATMIARLLEKGPVDAQEEAARDPMVAAVLGGMNPQHVIVTGLGASPTDSVDRKSVV